MLFLDLLVGFTDISLSFVFLSIVFCDVVLVFFFSSLSCLVIDPIGSSF
jgi:hypothetical protein